MNHNSALLEFNLGNVDSNRQVFEKKICDQVMHTILKILNRLG